MPRASAPTTFPLRPAPARSGATISLWLSYTVAVLATQPCTRTPG